MTSPALAAQSPFRQPKAVWAVAFACVISFMGIGLVDPILPALRVKLHATPSQVELLFTSYLVVTAVAMLAGGHRAARHPGCSTACSCCSAAPGVARSSQCTSGMKPEEDRAE
jgi:MFS family permease